MPPHAGVLPPSLGRDGVIPLEVPQCGVFPPSSRAGVLLKPSGTREIGVRTVAENPGRPGVVGFPVALSIITKFSFAMVLITFLLSISTLASLSVVYFTMLRLPWSG